MSLKKKKILLAITGSIAAYKAAFLCRLFIKNEVEVKVLMTVAATQFISPLTLSTLSKNKVLTEVSSGESWNNHVELGIWADAMIIAPATATTLAKMSAGIADNIVVAVYLSARCPVFFAPAMDLDMWKHPSTQQNVEQLQTYGNSLIPVENGELASGLIGDGRMAEPETIVDTIKKHFSLKQDFHQKKVLITAGPTYEPIDPVRFVGNRSSGKMGIAIAEAIAARGAEVDLVLGPTHLKIAHPNITVHPVKTAQQMYEAALVSFQKCDIAILAAAVADYRPVDIAAEKIKKKGETLLLNLEKTKDIAATLGKMKQKHQKIIGFALETNNEVHNASAKLHKKNFDFIVLNSLRDKGAGFSHDTNKITIVYQNNKIKKYELKSKQKVAKDIVDEIAAI